MKQIMLVSDKAVDYRNFTKPLKDRYLVDSMGYISTARYKLSKCPKSYRLIIIEIRMVTLGEFSLEETHDGDITGIVWYKKELVDLGIPVLFWSYEDPDYELEIEKLQEEYPNNKIDVIWRENSYEDHLLDGVKDFLKKQKKFKN